MGFGILKSAQGTGHRGRSGGRGAWSRGQDMRRER